LGSQRRKRENTDEKMVDTQRERKGEKKICMSVIEGGRKRKRESEHDGGGNHALYKFYKKIIGSFLNKKTMVLFFLLNIYVRLYLIEEIKELNFNF